MAAASSLFAAGLLALAGPNLIYPFAIAVVAVLVGAVMRRRARSRSRAVDFEVEVREASTPAASWPAPSADSCEAADRAAAEMSAERP